jgi:hypothetical protein
VADRLRISVTLHEPWLVFLRWLAAERGLLPAELARGLLEDALERVRADDALRLRYEEWTSAGGDPDAVAQEIVQALSVVGVVDALQGRTVGCTDAALHAARYLQLVSLWISNPDAPTIKGPCPRLADVGWIPLDGVDVDAALLRVGDGDGIAVRGAALGGRLMASDKRELSDSAPQGRTGGGHGAP